MLDLTKYSIIDLSLELCPTIVKSDGTRIYPTPSPGMNWDQTAMNFGQGVKHVLLRQCINAADGHWMHYIEAESHLGTHVEVGSHLRIRHGGTATNSAKKLLSVSEIPLETWIGEASVFNFEYKKPLAGKRQEITREDFTRVKNRDIVLMWSPCQEHDAPFLTRDAAEFLIYERRIKQLGGLAPFQGVSRPPNPSQEFSLHDALLENNIPFIEGLVGLSRIKKERVFFLGLPWRMQGLDACSIRAVVLEEKD